MNGRSEGLVLIWTGVMIGVAVIGLVLMLFGWMASLLALIVGFAVLVICIGADQFWSGP